MTPIGSSISYIQADERQVRLFVVLICAIRMQLLRSSFDLSEIVRFIKSSLPAKVIRSTKQSLYIVDVYDQLHQER